MEKLHRDLAACRMYGLRKMAKLLDMMVGIRIAVRFTHAALRENCNSACYDQAHFAFCSLGIKSGQPLNAPSSLSRPTCIDPIMTRLSSVNCPI